MSRKLAKQIAKKLLDGSQDSVIDTTNHQECEFILSAARLVLENKKFAKKIGKEISHDPLLNTLPTEEAAPPSYE